MNSLLSIVTDFLTTQVLPVANQLDTDPHLLFQALQGLGKLGVLTLKVEKSFGGRGLNDLEYGRFQAAIARYSGALAFLQTQHQSAATMLAASDNKDLQAEYFPLMGNGEKLVGVGFSHLRRRGYVAVIATPVNIPGNKSGNKGYLINGTVPWITGWGMFADFIVAATLADGSAVFGMVPFDNIQDGSIKLSPVAELMAMPSTNTVSARFENYLLSEEKVLFIKAPNWIHNSDRQNVLKATFLMMGCAEAGLRVIAENYEKKQLPFIHTAHQQLHHELTRCWQQIEQAIIQPQSSSYPENLYTQNLELRAWAINLMNRISQAAVTSSSGAANYHHHQAQRVYGESLVFSVTGQTEDVMETTLATLITPRIHHRSINHSRIIHLSHPINSDIPQWADDPATKFTTVAEIVTHGYFLRELSIGEHSATHINAPRSFHPDGATIDTYAAAKLVLPAVIIDISHLVIDNPDYLLTVADIQTWETQHGEIPPHNLVLLNTGWSHKWGNPDQFMNADDNQIMHFPGFSLAAAQFLLTHRHITGIGIDTHGVDGGYSSDFAVNRLILSQPRIVLENLTNLEKLPCVGVIVAIAPLLLQGGSGSPVGVLGIF